MRNFILLGMTILGLATGTLLSAEEAEPSVPLEQLQYHIFGPESAQTVLTRCTIHRPNFDGASSIPEVNELQEMEQQLQFIMRAVAKYPGVDKNYPLEYGQLPNEWIRQFVSYYDDDRRMIYGNYGPARPENIARLKQSPFDVCDGGPAWFGVEFDVELKKITRISFNIGWVSVEDLIFDGNRPLEN